MTLLTMARQLALNVGMPVPTQVISATDREWSEVVQMANEVGEELCRRVQWGALTKRAIIIVDGLTALPVDFDRMVDGVCMTVGIKPVRPLSLAEWATLPTLLTGTPRYFWLKDKAIQVWPEGQVTVRYQSDRWVNGANRFLNDDDAPIMDEALFLKGLIARWRRQKGMPYADEEAEFEGALQDIAKADDRSRL